MSTFFVSLRFFKDFSPDFAVLLVDPLDFRIKSRELSGSADQDLEVGNVQVLPAFTRCHDEDTRRVREGAFQGHPALGVGQFDQFAVAVDEFAVSFFWRQLVILEAVL